MAFMGITCNFDAFSSHFRLEKNQFYQFKAGDSTSMGHQFKIRGPITLIH